MDKRHKAIGDENLSKPFTKENEDFYWEEGLLVFTEKFHLKRGSCCKSGCRHCPYWFKRRS